MGGKGDTPTLDEVASADTDEAVRRLGLEREPTLDELTRTVDTEEAARRLGVQPSTLEQARWRGKKGFPPYVKIGGRVRYRVVDLAFFLAQTRQSTSEGAETTRGS